MPERIRNTHVLRPMARTWLIVPVAMTIPHVSRRIIVVRMAVARLELMSLTPILANMAVRAANSADRIA